MGINRQWQSLSAELQIVAEEQAYREEALRLFFSRNNPEYEWRFGIFTRTEIKAMLTGLLLQSEHDSSFRLLAAMEAAFRVDYKTRCESRKKDDLSRAFRKLYQKKKLRVRFIDDLLEMWKMSGLVRVGAVSDLAGAFNYRDWLAHGRHWTPKFGRNYDFYTVYIIALEVENFPLLTP